MSGHLHLVKLSVGSRSVASLRKWQRSKRATVAGGLPRHVTRMWPRRAEELLDGGSIYWVIKGVILCRQRILRLDEVVRQDGIRRCGIVLEPELVPTQAFPKKAFQGWRYLPAEDAPADLEGGEEGALPPALAAKLGEIGIL